MAGNDVLAGDGLGLRLTQVRQDACGRRAVAGRMLKSGWILGLLQSWSPHDVLTGGVRRKGLRTTPRFLA